MIVLTLLFIVGVLLAVYGICVAHDLPPYAPLVFGLEAASTCAAGIGTTVFAVSRNVEMSAVCALVAITIQALFVLDAWRRGFPIHGAIVADFKRP
jgi:hypothetical protein